MLYPVIRAVQLLRGLLRPAPASENHPPGLQESSPFGVIWLEGEDGSFSALVVPGEALLSPYRGETLH